MAGIQQSCHAGCEPYRRIPRACEVSRHGTIVLGGDNVAVSVGSAPGIIQKQSNDYSAQRLRQRLHCGGWKPPAGTSVHNRPRHRHMPAWRTSSDQILPALWSRSYSAAISAPLKSSPALYRRTFSSPTHFCLASLHGTYPVRRFTSASSSGDSRTKSPGMKQNLSERLMSCILMPLTRNTPTKIRIPRFATEDGT